MYVQALCSGLESVLEPYRQTLIDLEKSILRKKSAQLSFLQHKILPYQPVMRNICGLLHQIQYRKAHGCFLLDFIYKTSCSGVANVREAMQRLLHECHKVSKKIEQSKNFQRIFKEFHTKFIRLWVDKKTERLRKMLSFLLLAFIYLLTLWFGS